jgi:hypothetical protein
LGEGSQTTRVRLPLQRPTQAGSLPAGGGQVPPTGHPSAAPAEPPCGGAAPERLSERLALCAEARVRHSLRPAGKPSGSRGKGA